MSTSPDDRTFDRHIFTPGHSHVHSVHCPCEPSRIYWLDTLIRVIEHNDDNPCTSDWVLHVLDDVRKD